MAASQNDGPPILCRQRLRCHETIVSTWSDLGHIGRGAGTFMTGAANWGINGEAGGDAGGLSEAFPWDFPLPGSGLVGVDADDGGLEQAVL